MVEKAGLKEIECLTWYNTNIKKENKNDKQGIY